MAISFAARVRVPENVLLLQLEEESVLLHLDSEVYFGLDDVGTRMWTALTQSQTIGEAFERLAAEYDVRPAALRADLAGLIEHFVHKGLLAVEAP